jgi:hypothetical protein
VEEGVETRATIRTAAAAAVLALAAAPLLAQQTSGDRQQRYQVSQVERMLEGAVEHAATLIRDRLQAVLPAEMLISENARARGFHLEGYGVFFDVTVPSVQGTMPWIFQTLDQNDLALTNAFNVLKTHVDAVGDENLEQALERIELQIAPLTATSNAAAPAAASAAGASSPTVKAAASTPAATPATGTTDWQQAYHNEVRDQVMDAMLQYAASLGIGPEEWMTVALRPSDERPLIGPADAQEFTMVLRVRGDDLAAFRTGRYSKEEAVKHVQVRVF